MLSDILPANIRLTAATYQTTEIIVRRCYACFVDSFRRARSRDADDDREEAEEAEELEGLEFNKACEYCMITLLRILNQLNAPKSSGRGRNLTPGRNLTW
jgi:hypothetical protein